MRRKLPRGVIGYYPPSVRAQLGEELLTFRNRVFEKRKAITHLVEENRQLKVRFDELHAQLKGIYVARSRFLEGIWRIIQGGMAEVDQAYREGNAQLNDVLDQLLQTEQTEREVVEQLQSFRKALEEIVREFGELTETDNGLHEAAVSSAINSMMPLLGEAGRRKL